MPKSETFVTPLKIPAPAHETSIIGIFGSGILIPALEVNETRIRSPKDVVTLFGLRVAFGIIDISDDIEPVELSSDCARDLWYVAKLEVIMTPINITVNNTIFEWDKLQLNYAYISILCFIRLAKVGFLL